MENVISDLSYDVLCGGEEFTIIIELSTSTFKEKLKII